HLGDICTILTFGGYLYCSDIWGISVLSDIWGDICTVLTFGGYLYCFDIWGISVLS
ncbi:unnamed protein product, partial [Staurois parvus]